LVALHVHPRAASWEFRPLVQKAATIAWNLLQTLAKRLRATQGDPEA
jgi:hypothetical protein